MAERTPVRLRAQVNFRDGGGDVGTQCFRTSRKWRQTIVDAGIHFNALHPEQPIAIDNGVRYEQEAAVATFSTSGDPANFIDWLKRRGLIDAFPTLTPRVDAGQHLQPEACPQELDASQGLLDGTEEAVKGWLSSVDPEADGSELDAEPVHEVPSDAEALDAEVGLHDLGAIGIEPVADQSGDPGACQRTTSPQMSGELQVFPPSEFQPIEDDPLDVISDVEPFFLQQATKTEEYTKIFVESIETVLIVEVGGVLICLVLEDADEPDRDQLEEALARSQLDGRAAFVGDYLMRNADC